MPRRKEPHIPDAILDQLLAGADAKTAFEPNGLIDELKKALAERVLNAEMDHHLAGEEPGNRRNGYGKKTVVTDTGADGAKQRMAERASLFRYGFAHDPTREGAK
jgi:putative transposase